MTTQPNRGGEQASRPFGSTTVSGQSGMEDGRNPSAQQDKPAPVQEVQHRAKETMHEAEKEAKSRLDEGKKAAAHQVSAIAQAVRVSGDELREQEQPEMARYASMAADRIDRMANTLREKDTDQLMGEVEAFARRKPEVFLGTAFAAGVFVARFLKSSGQHSRERQWGESYNYSQSAERPMNTPAYESHYGQPPDQSREW